MKDTYRQFVVIHICIWRMMPDVAVDNESCKKLILNGVNGVSHNTQDVKTRQDRFSEVNLRNENRNQLNNPLYFHIHAIVCKSIKVWKVYLPWYV